jgi:hypothetical protein
MQNRDQTVRGHEMDIPVSGEGAGGRERVRKPTKVYIPDLVSFNTINFSSFNLLRKDEREHRKLKPLGVSNPTAARNEKGTHHPCTDANDAR